MNKKGEVNLVGVFVMVAITLIVGLLLFQVIAQEVGKTSETITASNLSVTLPSADQGKVTLSGQELMDVPVVYNTSSGVLVNTSVYSVAEEVASDTGTKRVVLTLNKYPTFYGVSNIGVTYTYGVEGYVDNSGGRAMASLIVVMFALAVLVVALTPTLRSGVIDAFGG